MSDDSHNNKFCLLTFYIGPVQSFIEAARTLRDLWSGSYLLAWLTASAMRPIQEHCSTDCFVTPHVDPSNPLLRAAWGEGKGDIEATLPTIPNRFTAIVPADDADSLKVKCLDSVRVEWKQICDSVRDVLLEKFPDLKSFDGGLDHNWDNQLDSYFDLKCVASPLSDDSSASQWKKDWDAVSKLMQMTRSVRHVPDYIPVSDANGRYPAKCSLLGSFEQMGPADFEASREFWKLLTDSNGLDGTRLQKTDRLCAISLVKRFAWAAYFAKTPKREGRIGVGVQKLRFPDTATVAAREWLKSVSFEPSKCDPERLINWSGQWLHWNKPNQDEDDSCPLHVWGEIQRQKQQQGPAPAYYAIIHMDGDNMGQLFESENVQPEWGTGRKRYQAITERLTKFSLNQVKRTVEEYHGTLVYSGGDDILALIPAVSVLACAAALRKAFGEALGLDSSISAGICVVHYKEDLRFALDAARRAEKAAKSIGITVTPGNPDQVRKKDALAITICRRSGEHSTAVLGWNQCPMLDTLVKSFIDGVSDRWTYKLRENVPALEHLPVKAMETELARLLKRTSDTTDSFREAVKDLYKSHTDELTNVERGWDAHQARVEFAKLCQAAGFLARGRD